MKVKGTIIAGVVLSLACGGPRDYVMRPDVRSQVVQAVGRKESRSELTARLVENQVSLMAQRSMANSKNISVIRARDTISIGVKDTVMAGVRVRLLEDRGYDNYTIVACNDSTALFRVSYSSKSLSNDSTVGYATLPGNPALNANDDFCNEYSPSKIIIPDAKGRLYLDKSKSK